MGLSNADLEDRVRQLSGALTSLIKEVYGNDGQSIPEDGLSRIDAITTELYGKNIENTTDYPGAVSVLDNVVHEVWGDRKNKDSQDLGNADYSSYAASEGIVASTETTSRIDEGMAKLNNLPSATNNNSNTTGTDSNTTNATSSGKEFSGTTFKCVSEGYAITRGGVNFCEGGFYLSTYGLNMNFYGGTINVFGGLFEFALAEFTAHLMGLNATVAGGGRGVAWKAQSLFTAH